MTSTSTSCKDLADHCLGVYTHTISIELARTVYMHRIFGDFPAKNTKYTPYIYGSRQNPKYQATHRAAARGRW